MNVMLHEALDPAIPMCFKTNPGRCVIAVIIFFCSLVLTPITGFAQPAYPIHSVLRTGSGSPLLSSMQTFGLPGDAGVQQVTFNFGFATDEDLLGGSFFDSATINLREVLSGLTEQFATIDRTGIYWAPYNPGGLTLNPDLITRAGIAFPLISGAPSNQWAFTVSVPIPAEFQGKTVELYLDLYDNQDAQQSLAWITPVPEPNLALWIVAAGGGWFFLRRFVSWK